MINQTTKDKIQILQRQYLNLAKGNESVFCLMMSSLVIISTP